MKTHIHGIPALFMGLFAASVPLRAQELASSEYGKERYFDKVQTYPMFESCEDFLGHYERQNCFHATLDKYIAQNLRYPDEARLAGIEGFVVARYIVEKDGTIHDVEIVEDPGYGCGQEVERLLKQLTPLMPGVHLGKIVRVRQSITVHFTRPR